MALRTKLSEARGLGTAKEGTHHWWVQRVTSIALIPLTIWFAFALASVARQSHEAVVAWLATPVNAVLMLLFIVATFHHLHLGIQTIMEDYLHKEPVKIAGILGVKLASAALGVAAAFAVLKIAFGA